MTTVMIFNPFPIGHRMGEGGGGGGASALTLHPRLQTRSLRRNSKLANDIMHKKYLAPPISLLFVSDAITTPNERYVEKLTSFGVVNGEANKSLLVPLFSSC